jgi:hypothetical protein
MQNISSKLKALFSIGLYRAGRILLRVIPFHHRNLHLLHISADIMSTPSLTELAADVAKHAKILQDYIDANNLPQPAFDKDAPLDFPVPNGIPEQDSRIALLEAAKALHDLAVGPTSLVMWAGMNVSTSDSGFSRIYI